MALVLPSAPDQSIAALRASAPAIASSAVVTKLAPKLVAALSSQAAPRLSPTLSYRVYTLGLRDLETPAADGLAAARLALWRHTLATDEEVVTADVPVGAGPQALAAVRSGSADSAVPAAIDALNQVPEVADASYEVSLLQVPALGVRALWLHDPAGRAGDLVVPVAPVRSELTAGRRYQFAEFAAALRPAVTRILADDDPRKGS